MKYIQLNLSMFYFYLILFRFIVHSCVYIAIHKCSFNYIKNYLIQVMKLSMDFMIKIRY